MPNVRRRITGAISTWTRRWPELNTPPTAFSSRARSLPVRWIKSSWSGSRPTRRARSFHRQLSNAAEGRHRNRIRKHAGGARRQCDRCQGIKGALKFQVRARVLADGGSVTATSNSVSVTNADSATILIALATSYKSLRRRERRSRKRLSKAKSPPPRARVSTSCSPRTSRNISGCSGGFRSIWAAATPCNRRRTSGSEIFTTATTRSLPRSTSNSAATC